MKQWLVWSSAAVLAALCLLLSCGGSKESSEECTDRDRDGYGAGCSLGGDCNDFSAYLNPGALEVCDGVDNNCSGAADEKLPITFSDAKLESNLILLMGLTTDTVYNRDFCFGPKGPANSLVLDHYDIVSLNGIQYGAYVLGILSLSGNNITELTPLASLYNLQALSINNNPNLSDLGPLAQLPSLKALSVQNCNVSSLKPIYDNTTFGAGDTLDVTGNPLDYASCCTYIPALKDRGATVEDGGYCAVHACP